ncbi:MAG: type II/IV secretion system protein [Thermodesulfobacteriota bacterium]
MGVKWQKTQYVDVRYREHPERTHHNKPDRYYVIRYKLRGKLKEEQVGWASRGMTALKANKIRGEIFQNIKKGKGFQSLKEKRQIKETPYNEEERKKRLKEKKQITFGKVMLEKIGEIAIKKGLITQEQLRDALIIQREGDPDLGIQPGDKVGRVLLKMKFIKAMDLVRILYEQKGHIDFLLIGNYVVEPRVVTWLSAEEAASREILPLVSMDDTTLMVATNRPLPAEEIKDLETITKKTIETVEIDDEDILGSIKACYYTFKKRGNFGVRIGEILVRDKYIGQEDLDAALEESKKSQRMIGKVLIDMGKVNELDFFKILSKQKNMAVVTAHDILPILDRELGGQISKSFCIRNLVIPYLRDGDRVSVVTSEPTINPDELARPLKCKYLDVKLASYSDINMILRTVFQEVDPHVMDELSKGAAGLVDLPLDGDLMEVGEEDITKISKKHQNTAGMILIEGIKKGASDIHLENYEDKVVVRFRIDGTLYDIDYLKVNKSNITGIVNVLKVQANMDISERRLPQGGRFRKKTKDKNVYDFRIQSQPALYGENMVLRILKQSGQMLNFDQLGLAPDIRARYEKLVSNPSGLILITGPTGSGKTTTLYSSLETIKKDLKKKIITLEDPVEYSLDRIQQCQVREDIGFGFDSGIRAFLREDPDVMLIGEIRDKNTATEAFRASQTGHLVFSTLHTSNAIEAVQRLLDIGLEPGTIASELILVMAQRLAKKNCQHCKKEYRPSRDLLDTFYPNSVPHGLVFLKGMGCEDCDFRGHKGRIAIHEFWFIEMESKNLILKRAPFDELFSTALAQGMMPMIEDALMKVESGLITLDELPGVIPYFQIVRWKGIHSRLQFKI